MASRVQVEAIVRHFTQKASIPKKRLSSGIPAFLNA